MSAPDILLSRSFSSYLSCMSFSIARWSHPNVILTLSSTSPAGCPPSRRKSSPACPPLGGASATPSPPRRPRAASG
eukprot:7382602-Prymnesium_polylepis.1